MSLREFLSTIKFNFNNFFSFCFFIAAFAFFFWVGKAPNVSEHTKGIINLLGNVMLLIMGFYFGSSKGSKDKTETIQKLQKQLGEKV